MYRLQELALALEAGNLSRRINARGHSELAKALRDVDRQGRSGADRGGAAYDEGRGFAVVADEVRRLAVRTAESTGKSRTLVDNTLTWVRQAHPGAEEVAQLMDAVETRVHSADETLHQCMRSC